MKLTFLIVGILAVGFAFSYSRKVGGALLITIVLGLLYRAKRLGRI